MTFEEHISNLYDKYGNEFNWMPIGVTDKSFISELNSELNQTHDLFGKIKRAVAKCQPSDDVLFLSPDDKWYIVHLTYSKNNAVGYPQYIEFSCLQGVIDHIEKQFVADYL